MAKLRLLNAGAKTPVAGVAAAAAGGWRRRISAPRERSLAKNCSANCCEAADLARPCSAVSRCWLLSALASFGINVLISARAQAEEASFGRSDVVGQKSLCSSPAKRKGQPKVSSLVVVAVAVGWCQRRAAPLCLAGSGSWRSSWCWSLAVAFNGGTCTCTCCLLACCFCCCCTTSSSLVVVCIWLRPTVKPADCRAYAATGLPALASKWRRRRRRRRRQHQQHQQHQQQCGSNQKSSLSSRKYQLGQTP